VSLFVLSPEIKDLDEVEIEPGRSTKRPTLNDIPGAPKFAEKLSSMLLSIISGKNVKKINLLFCRRYGPICYTKCGNI
jgi:hypothetical protein